MKQQKVIILKGLPCSNKTTWAKALIEKHPNEYKRVNKDLIREMLDFSEYSKDREKLVLKVRDAIIVEALKYGKNVIVDDTNLNPVHEEHIRELVEEEYPAKIDVRFYGDNIPPVRIEVKEFDLPVQECIERDKLRDNPVGEEVIRREYERWIRPYEKYVGDESMPKAIIVDIDGCLAQNNSGRSFYDWKRVGEDDISHDIKHILDLYRWDGNKIIIFTGRDAECESETKEWLEKHDVRYDHFDMRKEGDTRKDSIVKREMFDKIKDKYNVKAVFDDRKQVVDMWRGLGLRVFDVAGNDF